MIVIWAWLILLEGLVTKLSEDQSFERRVPRCIMFQALLLMYTLFFNKRGELDLLIECFWLSIIPIIGYALTLFWRWLESRVIKRVQMNLIVAVHLVGCIASFLFKMHVKEIPLSSLHISMVLW